MITSVSIPIDEWFNARRLLALINDDERSPFGQVRLTSNGKVRDWSATDAYRGAYVSLTADGASVDVGISPTLFEGLEMLADGIDELTLNIDDEADVIELVGPGGVLAVEAVHHDMPSVVAIVPDLEDIKGSARVSALRLHQAVTAVARSRQTPEDGTPPPGIVLAIGDTLQVRAEWSDVGETFVQVAAEEVTGDVMVEVNPRFLLPLIELFDRNDELVLKIPKYNNQPVILDGPTATCVLMPVKNSFTRAREHVESLIEDVCGHLSVVRDADGDYPLQLRSMPVFGRLVFDEEPALLQVFAVVLGGIPASDELYRELNDLNANSSFARLFHVGEQVLAEVDLVAETLDASELRTAINGIREVGETIMPTLSMVLGGSLVEDPASARLRSYRTAVIDAEVMPGRLAALNGIDGVAEWPFPGPVHVITGWNPQGVGLGADTHESINVRIAEDIIRHGARFVDGHGRSPSGDHSEPSLIAWGLSRDAAIAMGRRANQDSIFEIDAETVTLVSCVDGSVEQWARLG
jgi:hypothetical protein